MIGYIIQYLHAHIHINIHIYVYIYITLIYYISCIILSCILIVNGFPFTVELKHCYYIQITIFPWVGPYQYCTFVSIFIKWSLWIRLEEPEIRITYRWRKIVNPKPHFWNILFNLSKYFAKAPKDIPMCIYQPHT